MKPVPYTRTCAWQSTHFNVFVSILEVLETYSCCILWSIRPYTPKHTAVYSEVYGRILAVHGYFHSSNHATMLIRYPPPLATSHDFPTHKHIVHTNEHYMSKAKNHKQHHCLMSHPKCQMCQNCGQVNPFFGQIKRAINPFLRWISVIVSKGESSAAICYPIVTKAFSLPRCPRSYHIT